MTDYSPRLFTSDAEIERVAEGMIARTLPRPEWTHEAHIATTAYLLLRRPDIDVDKELSGFIRRYNESVGGVNSDSEGYHETITRFWIGNARAFLARETDGALVERVNRFIAAPEGRRSAPLAYFSRARLFSVEARRHAVNPDLMRFEWDETDAAPAPQL